MTPITEKSLFDLGFKKKANMYNLKNVWLQLIKGHTWVLSRKGFDSIDVKTIEEITPHIVD